MNPILFLVLLTLGAIGSIAYPIVVATKGYGFQKQIKQIGAFILITALIVGTVTGSFYSHGFNIPWWGFSIIYAAACFAMYSLGKFVVWAHCKLQNT